MLEKILSIIKNLLGNELISFHSIKKYKVILVNIDKFLFFF